MNQGLRLFLCATVPLFLLASCGRDAIQFGRLDERTTRSFISRIGDKEIQFGLTDAEISKFPNWSPKQPLPLPTPHVIAIAEGELPKLTHGTAGWYVRGISIEQIRRSSDGNDKWIYLVSYGGIGDQDSLQIPITFAGEPVKGIERSRSQDDR